MDTEKGEKKDGSKKEDDKSKDERYSEGVKIRCTKSTGGLGRWCKKSSGLSRNDKGSEKINSDDGISIAKRGEEVHGTEKLDRITEEMRKQQLLLFQKIEEKMEREMNGVLEKIKDVIKEDVSAIFLNLP